MNPVAISRGHSFKGITAYLHGKGQEPRAEWSEALNVGTQNPYMAARFMAATAMDAKRKQPKGPVWHWQMSWDEEQQPSAKHQAEAAKKLLQSLGLDHAQAMLVGHNDNGRAHVHLVVNLINPETGRIWHDHRFPDNAQRNCTYQSHTKAQAFALDYCREHGITSSPNREKNAAAREEAKATGDKTHASQMEGRKRLSRQEWQLMKDTLYVQQAAEREALKAKHKGEWATIKAKIEKRQKAERAAWRTEYERQKQAAKAEFKPHWRALYQSQREEERASAARIAQAARDLMRSKTFVGRTFGALGLARSSFQREGDLAMLKMQRETMLARQEAQQLEARQVQGRLVMQRTKSEVAKRQEPRLDLGPVKETQNREWADLRAKQTAEREAAGLHRQQQAKAREQDNRTEPGAREQAKERENARQREHEGESHKGRKPRQYSKEQLDRYRRWQEKERQGRDRGQDYGRER